MSFAGFAAPVSSDPASLLAQYGPLGIIAVILIAFARTAYNREVKRADACEAEVRRLNGVIQTGQGPVIAALTESSAALRDAGNLTLELVQLVRDLQTERALLNRGDDRR